METSLRKSQSLRCVATEHAPSWTEAGLRDRKKSVSQLVEQYQNASPGKAKAADSAENKHKILQFAAFPISGTETKLDTLIQRSFQEKPNAWADWRSNANLARSKSMEFLPNQKAVSTSALRDLFESKVALQPNSVRKPNDNDKPGNGATNQRSPEDLLVFLEADRNTDNSKESVAAANEKEVNVIPKAVRTSKPERRKTTTGVSTERIAVETDDKRRSIADFRDGSTLYGREKFPISVKAISALYLSKVAAAKPTGNLLKPTQDCTSPTKAKIFKFQAAAQDKCTTCQRAVYSMEKIAADKHVFHKNCFRCKHCDQKLSLRNYTALYGEFFCVFHYQQLFKKNGNYDEGFGHEQHKKRWLSNSTINTDLL